MRKLCIKLPPFSPDYSGVCSALFDLGGMVVINDAAGCTGNYTGYDEPRWFDSRSLIFCSGLRELDAVLGDDEKLINKILRAAEELSPRFIAVLGSPVPMVIGSDMAGIARELELACGIPCFGFDTNGLNYYDRGAGEAMRAVAGRFAGKAAAARPRSLNLLGATPLDFAAGSNVSDIRTLFESEGYQVLATFAMGSALEEIGRCGEASVNLVLSASGVAPAKYLEQRFGTPWLSGAPIGERGTGVLLENLAATEKNGATTSVRAGCRGGTERSDAADILILHDQIIANSLRLCLLEDYGIGGADVATAFGFEPGLAQAGDAAPDSELEISQKLNSGYRLIIGDPLYKQLLHPESGTEFIPFPHVAVSSKLYWDSCAELAGKKIHAYLADYANRLSQKSK